MLQAANGPASWQGGLPSLGRTVHYCTPSLKQGPAAETLAQRFEALSGGYCAFFNRHNQSLTCVSRVCFPQVSHVHASSSVLRRVQAMPSPRCC